jgi:hypothetical protein
MLPTHKWIRHEKTYTFLIAVGAGVEGMGGGPLRQKSILLHYFFLKSSTTIAHHSLHKTAKTTRQTATL